MDMQSTCFRICSLALAIAVSPLQAQETTSPVLWKPPECSHQKLGSVAIESGKRVYGHTKEFAAAVSYADAFAKLAAAAEALGGDAVVIRWHQATYFTRFGKRSRTPVHLQLRGAAIRIEEDAAGCDLAVVDSKEFANRAKRGDPMTVDPGDAYSH